MNYYNNIILVQNKKDKIYGIITFKNLLNKIKDIKFGPLTLF